VTALANRILVIEQGKLVYDGDLQALVAQTAPYKLLRLTLDRPVSRADLSTLGEVESDYRALLKAAWATALEYRAQILLWILSFLFPLVMMVVWLAVVDEVGPAAGWDRADFVSYYVGMALVNQLTFAWIVWNWDEDIRTGKLSVKLLKPLDPFHHLLSEQLGWKLFILLFLLPVVAVIAWLSPTISYPLTPGRVAACVLSVVAGFALSMLMGSTFGVLAFWSTQTRNLYSLWIGVG
jgi:ABC-2 type transport system permease protein